MNSKHILSISALLVAGLGLSACSGQEAAVNSTVRVTASDSSCELDIAEIPVGSTRFEVSNTGNETTEVYVYSDTEGAFTNVVSEVEDIGPGASRDMVVDLTAGTYEIACKPGQTGDGIRTPLVVNDNGEDGAE